MNCWEYKRCGREAGGLRAAELGVCPAFPLGGTTCATVAGTLCGGMVQGTFAQKLGTCLSCEFYRSEHYTRPGRGPQRCWEFMQCGREAGGANAHLLGVCTAYPSHGRACARVAGTLCGGTVQGTFAQKLGTCLSCRFYTSENYDRLAAT